MRRAVFELGPSGFPFEKLLGEIFKSKGYDVQVGVILSGQCVTHETDVVARKGLETILVEAKFHNNQSFKTDVKVALAVHARFLDLERAGFRDVSSPGGHCEPWLMTNTKFTEQAITFGHCVGITMVGWGYPQKGNVQDLIEEAGLHPVSCLTTLAQKEKDALYQHGIVLCKNVIDNPNLLEQAGVSRKKVDKVVNEANRLCNL